MSLTKYKEGSLGELLTIAFPLMISSLSLMSMLFVDRLLLAQYSTQALTAAVNATTLGWSFLLGWMALASIAEVFVAQYNGAGERHKMGEPVWQMIWLALLSVVCFLPLSLWGGGWFFQNNSPSSMENEYFTWMMLFGPSTPLYSALCGFFIGQGKTRLITILAVITNIVNAFLDMVLIFGIEGWIPSMGVKGAAIATCGSGIFQVMILAAIFLRPKNRLECGTGNFQIRPAALLACVKIGLPNAAFCVLEVFAWAMYYAVMTRASETHITVAGIVQSVIILLFFFAEGMNKAVSTIVGNLIGAKKTDLVNKVLLSGIKVHLIFFFLIVLAIFVGFDYVVDYFLPKATKGQLDILKPALFFCLMGNTLYLLFEGIRMLFVGALTAAGDTMFILVAGVITVWLLMLAPIYAVVTYYEGSVEFATVICIFYSIAVSMIYYWRFLQDKWKTISLIAAEPVN